MRLIAALILVAGIMSYASCACAEERWRGVDETVVGKYAAEKGREAKPLCPLQGDTQLFAFLIAGAAGGFALGYLYRDQLSKKRMKE